MLRHPAKLLVVIFAALLAVGLGTANILLGPLNLDEGWYLLSAKSFSAGRLPYRDFFFTQSPLLPAVYGILSPLWADAGVLGGRILTAILGLCASLLAAAAAALAAGKGRRFAAATTVFLLLQCNVVHSYFTTIPKTYALASLFVSGALLALAAALRPDGRRRVAGAAATGFLLALAAGTRLSLGALLPVAGLCLLAAHRRHRFLWFWFGVGGAIGLVAAFAPFVCGNWDDFAFANFFHGGRAGGGASLLAGSVARLARNYLPVAILALFAAVRTIAKPDGCNIEPDDRRHSLFIIQVSLLPFVAAFLVHVTAPFPYDDYQTPIMPLAAIAASLAFWETAGDVRQNIVLPLFLALAFLFAATSPFCESWLVLRKDRFWVEKKSKPDLAVLRETAREIDAMLPPGAPLLTQDAYLAVECGRPVPPGFEMGTFGYFAELSDEKAAAHHVLNRNLALQAIQSGKHPVIALSGYAFAMSAPELVQNDAERATVEKEIAKLYRFERTVPDFGQEHTALQIWTKR